MSDFGKSGKERVREYKAMESILRGETPEKRIIVGYEGKKKKLTGKTIQGHLTDIMKEVRMPWFCPECKKTMKAKVNDKMWRLFGHCFDCQVKIENKLRIEGKYEEWEEKKVLNNQLSYIKDQINSIDDWKDETSKPLEVFDQVGVQDIELHTEKWSQNKEKVEEMSNEALEELNKMKEDVEEKLNSFEI